MQVEWLCIALKAASGCSIRSRLFASKHCSKTEIMVFIVVSFCVGMLFFMMNTYADATCCLFYCYSLFGRRSVIERGIWRS